MPPADRPSRLARALAAADHVIGWRRWRTTRRAERALLAELDQRTGRGRDAR